MFARLAVAAAVALSAAPALADPANPVAAMGEPFVGTVKAASADHVLLATDKGDVDVLIGPATRVLVRKAASADEIKAGGYLGTSNKTSAVGGEATEVHMMDNGPNVHFAMDDKGLMMTNGHVTSVRKTAKGEEMDVDYGAGVRHVVVPAGTPVTWATSADVTALKVGAAVTARARAAEDGKLTATYISVEPPK